MSGELWDSVSVDAKDFIGQLLKYKPSTRLPIDQVLEHPWLKQRPEDKMNPEVTRELLCWTVLVLLSCAVAVVVLTTVCALTQQHLVNAENATTTAGQISSQSEAQRTQSSRKGITSKDDQPNQRAATTTISLTP